MRDKQNNRDENRSKSQQKPSPIGDVAAFSLLYSSRDGKLCVFEDRKGHLIAADSRRFA